MEKEETPDTNKAVGSRHRHNLELESSSINFTPNYEDNFISEDFFVDVAPGTSNGRDCFGKNLTCVEYLTGGSIDCVKADIISLKSIGLFVCRICHNSENSDRLVSPCLCKGSLTYVHIYCLERWISTSRCTTCELCQFQYNTQQSLRYTWLESLRLWYSRSMSRRALREDCQMFSLLTLVAFGIIGTLLVAAQYYILQSSVGGLSRLWTKGWLLFILFTTLGVYMVNVYMIVKSQLEPWYRWWQSARDIRLILEDRKPLTLCQIKSQRNSNKAQPEAIGTTDLSMNTHQPVSEGNQCQCILQSSLQTNIANTVENMKNLTTVLPQKCDSKMDTILEMKKNHISKLPMTTTVATGVISHATVLDVEECGHKYA